MPSIMYKMYRFRSSCACAKHHPGLCCPFIHSVVSNNSVNGQRRPWSDCADAQADLGRHCPHMPESFFRMARSTWSKNISFHVGENSHLNSKDEIGLCADSVQLQLSERNHYTRCTDWLSRSLLTWQCFPTTCEKKLDPVKNVASCHFTLAKD